MKPDQAWTVTGKTNVVPYIGTWIETGHYCVDCDCCHVVPYIGTWIETGQYAKEDQYPIVVPYIGTWIETETE